MELVISLNLIITIASLAFLIGLLLGYGMLFVLCEIGLHKFKIANKPLESDISDYKPFPVGNVKSKEKSS